MGVPYDEFFRRTIRELQSYDDAHKLKLKEQDYMNYLMGEYVFEAVGAVASGMFAKKGSQPKQFTELCPKPILDHIDEQKQIEDEKTAYERYRMQRQIEKLNWDLAQIYAKKGR